MYGKCATKVWRWRKKLFPSREESRSTSLFIPKNKSVSSTRILDHLPGYICPSYLFWKAEKEEEESSDHLRAESDYVQERRTSQTAINAHFGTASCTNDFLSISHLKIPLPYRCMIKLSEREWFQKKLSEKMWNRSEISENPANWRPLEINNWWRICVQRLEYLCPSLKIDCNGCKFWFPLAWNLIWQEIVNMQLR